MILKGFCSIHIFSGEAVRSQRGGAKCEYARRRIHDAEIRTVQLHQVAVRLRRLVSLFLLISTSFFYRYSKFACA